MVSRVIFFFFTRKLKFIHSNTNGNRDARRYLDQLETTWEQMYVAEPTEGIPEENQHLVLGGEGCMWGEKVDASDIQQTIWPRAAAISERLWSPRALTRHPENAEDRLAEFRCLLNRRGIASAPYSNDHARDSPAGPGGCLEQRR